MDSFGFAKVLYFTRSFSLLEVPVVCVVLPSVGNPRVGVSGGMYLSLLPDWYHLTGQLREQLNKKFNFFCAYRCGLAHSQPSN